MIKKVYFLSAAGFFFLQAAYSQPVQLLSSGETELALKKLNTVGSVLYIAAHPDDENTRLLSYFANEKLLRTAYLSITRGDGGQNLTGNEQGELLGLIRTQELLEARKIDGAEQYFTRAIDFGFSKNPEETFRIWEHDKVLADVVWVIRNFKPDIIITRFPETGAGGHGHHTASAILAREAFFAAADSNKFSEQLNYVDTWQAKSIWWNTFNFGSNNTTSESQYHFDAGAFNSYLGKSYGEIASESRSMHKSQGFGVAKMRGKLTEYFIPLAGDTSCHNIYCNMDLTWNKEGKKFSGLVANAINKYESSKPEKILPLLIDAHNELINIKDEGLRQYKTKEIEKIIFSCAGLWYEAAATDYSVIAGDSAEVKISVIKNNESKIKLNTISFDDNTDTLINNSLIKSDLLTINKKIYASEHLDYSTPYWLKEKPLSGTYYVNELLLIGKAENDASIHVRFSFSIEGKEFNFKCPVIYKWTDPVHGEKYRSLEIRPVAGINFSEKAYLITGEKSKKLSATVRAEQDSLSGKLTFRLKAPYKIEPSVIPLSFKTKGEEQTVEFMAVEDTLKKDSVNTSFTLKAYFSTDDKKNSSDKMITEIRHDHINFQTVFKNAETRLVQIDLKKSKKKIGYIPGAGDDIPESLNQAGYEVTFLTNEMLRQGQLQEYDAIITGIRAYNVNEQLSNYHTRLMEYVKQGGNLIVQYNTSNNLSKVSGSIGPYPFKISRERITDERAPVTFHNPAHPLLNAPNKITEKDFDNWVQERGLYFPEDYDEHYETLISSNDPDDKVLKSAILTCKYGKGNFIYTSLSFFRQLPAGVPGAYRLFINMISLR